MQAVIIVVVATAFKNVKLGASLPAINLIYCNRIINAPYSKLCHCYCCSSCSCCSYFCSCKDWLFIRLVVDNKRNHLKSAIICQSNTFII